MMSVRGTVLAATTAVGLALGGAAAPAAARAQPVVQAQTPAPSCLATVPAPDSVSTVLHLSLGVWHPVRERSQLPEPSAAEREALIQVLRHMHRALALPRDLPVLLNSDTRFDSDVDTTHSPLIVHPALRGEITLTLHEDGSISNVVLEQRSGSGPLDSTLVAMLRRAGSTGAFPNLVGPLGPDSVRLLLATTHHPEPRQVSAPLARLRLPAFAATPVHAVRAPRPRYPGVARIVGLSDSVHVWFVVDTAGHVDVSTVQVVAAQHEEFEREVRLLLPRLRFRPMRVAGCLTRQLVQRPFVFKAYQKAAQEW